MADRYLVTGGTGFWNNTNMWSTTSGGPSGASIPTSTDDVFFDINSYNQNIVISAATSVNTLFCSGYTGTLGINAILTNSSALTYSSGMIVTGTSAVNLGNLAMSSAIINFNGVFHNTAFSFSNGTAASTVYTITGDIHIGSSLSFANGNLGGAGTKIVLNGGNVYAYAGFSIFGNGNRWLGGTSSLNFIGGGSGNFTSGVAAYIIIPITFAKTGGTINMTVGALYPRNSTVTYVSGNFTNFIFASNAGSNNFETSGMTWSSGSIGGGAFGLLSQLNVAGTFTNTISNTINGTGGINCTNLTTTNNLLFPTGSTTTINGTLTATGTAAAPITIGTVTAGLRANMILNYNGNQDVSHTNGRDIDSDGGLTIMSYKATSISNCDNWTTLPITTSASKTLILR